MRRPIDPSGKPATSLHLRIPEPELARLDEYAERTGTTRSQALRDAIAALLDRREAVA